MTEISEPIAVRCYASAAKSRGNGPLKKKATAWNYAVVFDCETLDDCTQKLQFGAYQVRHEGKLLEEGLIYGTGCTESDVAALTVYVEGAKLKLLTRERFVEGVLLEYAYERRGTCIGFNLPFDLSRVAMGWSPAKSKQMQGGFSFQLSPNPYRPRLLIRTLSRRAAFFRWATPKGKTFTNAQAKRKAVVGHFEGSFVDVKTLASALLSGSWSLGSLCKYLRTKHQKIDFDDYGAPVTPEAIAYCLNDVRATWDCYESLVNRFEGYGLTGAVPASLFSEASLGKAYLKSMGVKPWRNLQPDFPEELLGYVMSTYYGGRAEVRVRRQITDVLYCDFLSMYPTVCVLMGLWKFVTAKETQWRDNTDGVRRLLEDIQLDDVRDPKLWSQLHCIVQVQPDSDVLPVRAAYKLDSKGSTDTPTIGLNYIRYEKPLWYTLADCIASKLHTGKAPKVLRAIRFEAGERQDGLKPIELVGKSAFRIDPDSDDFYKSLIELRISVKARKAAATGGEESRLDTEQLALKLCANATSYGIFVEVNVSKADKQRSTSCFGPFDEAQRFDAKHVETPGNYFHPLLGTLICGAARLILSSAECVGKRNGVGWAFCDTDSMAFFPGQGMNAQEFREAVKKTREWFRPLNPYAYPGASPSILEEEAVNRPPDGGDPDGLLKCLAISAKRYALYNDMPDGTVCLRFASGHGLGHLLYPYPGQHEQTSKRIPQWQHDFWQAVIDGYRSGTNSVHLSALAGFSKPAATQFTIGQASLMKPFGPMNSGKDYQDQIKPYNFMLRFQPLPEHRNLSPIAPYDRDPELAAQRCIDRTTNHAIPVSSLSTYEDALGGYHLHPEKKFEHGRALDVGSTKRRLVNVTLVQLIGKESDSWEDKQNSQDPSIDVLITYGLSVEDMKEFPTKLSGASKRLKLKEIAAESGVSAEQLRRIAKGRSGTNPQTVAAVMAAISRLDECAQMLEEDQARFRQLLADRVTVEGLASVARSLKIDKSNLRAAINGHRRLSARAEVGTITAG